MSDWLALQKANQLSPKYGKGLASKASDAIANKASDVKRMIGSRLAPVANKASEVSSAIGSRLAPVANKASEVSGSIGEVIREAGAPVADIATKLSVTLAPDITRFGVGLMKRMASSETTAKYLAGRIRTALTRNELAELTNAPWVSTPATMEAFRCRQA